MQNLPAGREWGNRKATQKRGLKGAEKAEGLLNFDHPLHDPEMSRERAKEGVVSRGCGFK